MYVVHKVQTVLQGGLVMAKNGRLELGDNICGYYKCICNHCDVYSDMIGCE